MRLKCPKCKRCGLRKQVSLFVDCPAECYRLGKRGLRSAEVKINGADWPQERFYCPTCGWFQKWEERGHVP